MLLVVECVYEKYYLKELVDTMSALSSEDTRVLIPYKIRPGKEQSYELFFDALGKRFEYE